MKESNNDLLSESISTLVDGEASNSDTMLNQITANSRLRQQWQNYHLIRDALHDELPRQVLASFSERVMSAIDNEPAILAPRALKKPLPQFVKPLLGAAIAATVAAVTVISVQSFDTQEFSTFKQAGNYPSPSESPLRSAAKTGAIATAGPRHFDRSDKGRWEGSREDLQEVLNDYLMTHTENAQAGQIRGIVPYARLAGFNGKAQ